MFKKTLLLGFMILTGLFMPKTSYAKSLCQDFESALCIQVYAPVWCVSLSVGGEVVKKPIFAKGSNACVATNQLRKKACDKGLSWKDLADEEVHCVALPR